MKTQEVKIWLLAGLLAVVAAAIGPGHASAATQAVCPSGCTFTQIAPALAAAKNGDTISIGAGTYDGGLTIDKSVKLVGAGSGRTTISGGGPVLTIGTFGASSEPTVMIDGVTITGGVTRSSPESTPFTGHEGYSRPAAASRSRRTPTSPAARPSRSRTARSRATGSPPPTRSDRDPNSFRSGRSARRDPVRSQAPSAAASTAGAH